MMSLKCVGIFDRYLDLAPLNSGPVTGWRRCVRLGQLRLYANVSFKRLLVLLPISRSRFCLRGMFKKISGAPPDMASMLLSLLIPQAPSYPSNKILNAC